MRNRYRLQRNASQGTGLLSHSLDLPPYRLRISRRLLKRCTKEKWQEVLVKMRRSLPAKRELTRSRKRYGRVNIAREILAISAEYRWATNGANTPKLTSILPAPPPRLVKVTNSPSSTPS